MSPLKWTDSHINTLWETTPTFDVSLTLHSPPVLTFPRRLSLSHWTCSLSGRRASQHLFGVQRHSQKTGTHSALTPRHQAFSSRASSRWRKSCQLSYRGFAVSESWAEIRTRTPLCWSNSPILRIAQQKRSSSAYLCGTTATQTP